MRHILTRASILMLTLAVLRTLVLAQAGGATAEIKGKVTDPNGGGVPGVTITVTDAAKGIVQSGSHSVFHSHRRFSAVQPMPDLERETV